MAKETVVVVGGGLIGCLSALRLADAGARVLVLERSVPGAEASSAAAGILAAQLEARAPGPMFELGLASRERYGRLSEELRERVGLDVGYRVCGLLEVCKTEAELDELAEKAAFQRAQGLTVEKLSHKELLEREPHLSTSLHGALAFPHDAQVDPPRLVAAVAQAAERAGVRFRSGAVVREVKIEGSRVVGVQLDDEVLPADHVVIAAGAWSSLVAGAHVSASTVRPARGQIVELQMRTPPMRSVVYGPGGYLVPRLDGRVLCGSTLEFVGYRKEVTVAGVLKLMNLAVSLVPSLEHAVVGPSWSNFRPWSADGAPLVGSVGVDGLTLATGHYRSGILLAPITAELVCKQVLGTEVLPEAWNPKRSSLSGTA